ncbi:PREDICTED: LOW QUALITY PROTEIN: protein LKAAEAR1 [Miniopterus natalensis]|uniref:LOW QUALITY PROTEIN: protein LKAAEAR1 n=1 Tax=Miniopterus natalensis TaxID=291302 RepID=UPI0007A72F27|nr:PREDICTED: LOW QUALITY PROTEIN: protein LKAAEAR1 [Miniopterus natalensis]
MGCGKGRAGSCETYTEGAPASEPPKPGWALTLEGLEAMSPKQGHRHLLFGDLLEDVGAAASIFPRESTELGYGMPDPRAWTQALEPPAVRQDRLLGVLKAAEARGRVRALRVRYTCLRAEEISLLIQRQKSARAAIRLELFLPPQLKPTRIPDPLDRQEVPASPGRDGEGARPPPAHLATAPLPAAETRGDHPGGKSGRLELPALRATPRPRPTLPHKVLLLQSCWSLRSPSRSPRRERGCRCCLSHIGHHRHGGDTEWGTSNKARRCKGVGVNRGTLNPPNPRLPPLGSLLPCVSLGPPEGTRRAWLSNSHGCSRRKGSLREKVHPEGDT